MQNQITNAETYEYPVSGNYAETVATLADGRRVSVDVQYDQVYPVGLTLTLEGIDTAALVADARARGRFGRAPRAVETDRARAERLAGLADYETRRAATLRAMRE